MKENYSLHIVHYPRETIYQLTCGSAVGSKSGAMPVSPYATWQDLYVALDSVHVHADVLAEAKQSLDQKGTYTLQVSLEDDQLERLGFDPAKCK
jgi:hypothetical protein